MEDVRQALSADAAMAYGSARAAELRSSLERLAGAVAAVRAYPLSPVVEPATIPETPATPSRAPEEWSGPA